MTLAPHRKPLVFTDIDGVAAAIRAAGGRLSTVRRLLLEALFAAEKPVTAEQLADGLGGSAFATELSSVYRNLEALEALGVVRHLHGGHGPGLYTLERERRVEYLVCERCHRIDAIDADQLDGIRDDIETTFGYRTRFDHFPLVGLCAACSRQPVTGPPR